MKNRKLNLENLSSRALPSVSFTNGLLSITGTDGRDVVSLQQTADTIVVKGARNTDGTAAGVLQFPGVTGIQIQLGAGNDVVKCDRWCLH
jgi:hypothetical protein